MTLSESAIREHYRRAKPVYEALATVNDGTLRPEEIGMATIDVDSEQFSELSDEDIEEYLTAEDILEPADEESADEE